MRKYDAIIIGTGQSGPGGPARGHCGLSEMYCRNRAALWRVRGEVHGRWDTGLFRLSPSARGRR
jgi:hypothetical protein